MSEKGIFQIHSNRKQISLRVVYPGKMINGSLRMFKNIHELPLTISPGYSLKSYFEHLKPESVAFQPPCKYYTIILHISYGPRSPAGPILVKTPLAQQGDTVACMLIRC